MLSQTYNSDANLNLFVDLQDGSGNSIGSTSGALNVQLVAVTGTVAPGTAAASSLLTGAVYSSTLPTLTNGQQAALQVDASGRLIVDIGASSGELNVNLNQVGGTAFALGQALMAGSLPVAIASNQSAIATTFLALGSAAGGTAGTQSDLAGGIYNTTLPTLTNGQQAALQLDSSGRLLVDIGSPTVQNVNLADVGGAAIALGQTTMAASLPVVLASNQSAIATTDIYDFSSTATLTSVAVTNTSISLLAANASRKGAIIVNDTNQPIYVAFAATASTTAFTYVIAKTGGTLELTRPIYQGAISAITPVAATGKVFCTELV